MRRLNSRRLPETTGAVSGPDKPEVPLSIVDDPIFAYTQLYVDAVYHDSDLELPEYADNPLILALPAFTDRKAALEGLSCHFAVSHAKECTTWSAERRIMAIGRIDRLLLVLPVHVTLLAWMHTALRNHYVRINPVANPHRDLQTAYERVQGGKPGVVGDLVEGHAACRALVGMSGTGKSTAMKLILSLFPPVIQHTTFRGAPCRFRQLVWVYVMCPANGSVMAFFKDILTFVDERLDLHLRDEMLASARSQDYVNKITTVLRRWFAGVLVIDEFQNLLKAAASTELLDSVVNLLNSRCCCMMVMGTPETEGIIKTRLRLARRVASDGYEVMVPLAAGAVYEGFSREILALHFLRKPIANLKAVQSVILELSAGLPALVKLIPRLAQYMAIETGCEQITPRFLRQVQRELLAPLVDMTTALRNHDSKALALYVDMVSGETSSAHLRGMAKVTTGTTELHSRILRQTFAAAVASLLELGFTEGDADYWVNLILKEGPGMTAASVTGEVLRRTASRQSPTKPPGGRRRPRQQ